eukprot:UN20648
MIAVHLVAPFLPFIYLGLTIWAADMVMKTCPVALVSVLVNILYVLTCFHLNGLKNNLVNIFVGTKREKLIINVVVLLHDVYSNISALLP